MLLSVVADEVVITAQTLAEIKYANCIEHLASLIDLDGSESMNSVVSGVPTNAVMSGTDNGDGSYTHTSQLNGLTVTPVMI